LFLFQVLNLPTNTGRFNISTQFPYYREVLYKPDFRNVSRGKPVIFDMDMSPGDFVSLIYLLKEPREVLDLKVREIYVIKCTFFATNNVV
jgi:hypothetical protein